MIRAINENYTKFISDTSVKDSFVVKNFLSGVNNTKVNKIRAINPAGKNELSAACRTVEETEEKLEYELMRQKNLLEELGTTYSVFCEKFTSIE